MSLWKRIKIPALILSQPFEFCVSFSLAMLGIISLTDERLAPLATDERATALFVIWQIGSLASAAAILVSFTTAATAERCGETAKAWNRLLEQAGLVLMGMSAAVYAVVLASTCGRVDVALLATAGMGGIVAACVLRFIALRRIDRITLRSLVEEDRAA